MHAMHDCTEGGVLGATYEMSLASGLGFELWENRIPVASATREMCRKLGLDPLKLIGSGSLLIATAQRNKERVRRAVRRTTLVTEVGRFTKRGRHLYTGDGRRRVVSAAPEDELWRTLARSA